MVKTDPATRKWGGFVPIHPTRGSCPRWHIFRILLRVCQAYEWGFTASNQPPDGEHEMEIGLSSPGWNHTLYR